MKIKISNLGAIGEGVVDLSKRVTLLCGYNGTGKTYFSYVVYALFRNRLHIKGDDKLVDQLLNDKTAKLSINFKLLAAYRQHMLDAVVHGIDDLFGIGSETAQKLFSSFRMEYVETEEEMNRQVKEAALQSTLHIQGGVEVTLTKKAGEEELTLQIQNENVPNEAVMGLRFFLSSAIFHTLAVYPINETDVFPVERNSIYTFSKELSIRKQEAMDNFQMMINKDKKINKFDILFNSKRYPLPIKDGLLIAEDLAEIKKNQSEFYEFAEKLEEELFQGRVQISNDGEIQFKPQRALRTVLPIQMTASIIKTLSSLVVYLKHIAKPNDLIIIDEPEINLHPDNQIILARLLARLANKGFRLWISTHSDYIIREFNNLVMLSHKETKAVKRVADENGYKEDEYIEQSELAVYFFGYKNKTAKKVSVIPVPVAENGFEISSIDEVINRQNDISEALFYAWKYGEEKDT